MKKKFKSILVCFTLLITALLVPLNVNAVTDPEMEASGAAAVAYLASKQKVDGSWGTYYPPATTGLILLKLLVRAQEFDLDPFDTVNYTYANNVIAGFDYLFSCASGINISMQIHGDPDTNGNGRGICLGSSGLNDSGLVYYTGIALSALALSGHPDDRSATIGGMGLLTYRQIAQDMVDWLCYAQGDIGNDRGGFNYDALNNVEERTDNSNGGYAYLGLAFAEDPPFNCIIPDWVRDELNIYIDWIQNDVDGDPNDGGSGYDRPDSWVNVLKTGNLIFEMAFYGDTPSTPRVQDAVDYLERHWQDPSWDPGWGYSLPVADYQAKFLIEKGLTYMGITEIDTDGDGVKENWFNQEPPAIPAQDFASVIVQQQLSSGAWPYSNWDGESDALLSTAWAVLTLERFAPPQQQISIYVDIKPGSCPNPINPKSKGVLPVAICGTEDFDIISIDPSTILLTREGYENVSVSPVRWSFEDVATPYMGDEGCGCHDLNGDGYLDLSIKFNNQEVVNSLNLKDEMGNTIPLIITSNLKGNFSTPIMGQDCVWILDKAPCEKISIIYKLMEILSQRYPLLRLLLSYIQL